ncbi:hypothetical protein [Enterococcus ureasiticus]|uniref:Uncharacterized protein n=1 Tax=Enterococcus ureasiticus TaxID=903984 RepID=A0A1E5GA23_9ENTE|nr:hypothetical protein [Enterococcus ureasiticus]OEG09543.1 hypothetical protein BCR21_14425 [Enterococcus ureasiticus]
MTKKMKNFIGIVLFVAFSCFFVFTKAEVVEAYSWSKTLGNSPKVVKMDPENPNIGDIDPNAINIGLVGVDNTISIYNTNGVLTKTIPMYPASMAYHNNFMPNETARVSKAGIYKGRYVDLMFKNTGVYSGDINISPNGTVTFYRTNTYEAYAKYLTMKIVDHETSEEFKDNTFYMPTYLTSIGYSLGQYVKGYDKSLTKAYYIPSADAFLKSSAYLDTTSNAAFDFMSAQGNSKTGEGYFTIYGQTSAAGYSFGSITSGGSATALPFFSPGLKSPLPVDYLPLAIPKTASPSADQKKMELTMKQELSKQTIDKYVPDNDSFKLTITEENTTFLDIQKNDFSLFMNNQEVVNDGTAYTLDVGKSGDKTTITVNLKTSYLKEQNGIAQAKAIEIRQSSAIKQNESDMKAAMNEQKFTVPIAAKLSYDLKFDEASTLKKEIDTPNQDVTLALTPPLTADVTTGYMVTSGTKVSDIPIDNLVKNFRNTMYDWDQVTASYASPTTILSGTGNQIIVVNLISDTFGNTVPVNVTVRVQNNYILSYNLNGGQGTLPAQTAFTSSTSVIVASGATLSKEGATFMGWSLVAEPKDQDKIYKPGDSYGNIAAEKKSATLYAVWKLDAVLYTSWDDKTPTKELSKTIYRNTTETVLPFYWKTTDKVKYKVVVKSGSEIILTKMIENQEDGQELTEAELAILLEKVPDNGSNAVTVDFYELDSDDDVINPSKPSDTLNLTLIIEVPPTAEYTVNFVDEKGNALHEPYVGSGLTGSKVKLSDLQEIETIVEGLKADNYDLIESPADEFLIKPTGNNMNYKFTGLLTLVSAPSSLDFDIKKVAIKAEKFTNPEIKGNPLVVSDTRADKVKWNLKAKVDQPLTSLDNSSVIIPDSIKYSNQEEEIALTDEDVVIFSHTNTESGQYNVTQERWSKGEGFLLDLEPGAIKVLGKYQAKMTITLENAK